MPTVSLNPISQQITQTTYKELTLPSWAPSPSLFGPVRTVLYIIIFATYGYFLGRYVKDKKLPRRTIIPFVVNLILNFSFTYLQFGLEQHGLATTSIAMIWLTIIATIRITYKNNLRLLAALQIPYLLRVTFA